MSSLGRHTLWRWLVLAAALLLPPVAAAGSGVPSVPTQASAQVPGLRDVAGVTRDSSGVAHITARNRFDLFFLQGWVHAADRLFQMDVSRRQPSGTLAELLGTGALPSDVQMRTIGLRRAAWRSLGVLSFRTHEALLAYAAGVNAYVATHPLPPEYGALRLTRFQPWTPLDSVTIGKAVAFRLSFDLDVEQTVDLELYLRAGAQGGFDGMALFAQDIFRPAPFDPACTVPDASGSQAVAVPWLPLPAGADLASRTSALSPSALELARRYLKKAQDVPLLRRVLERNGFEGSNEWVIGGQHTVSGQPLLANDPHLPLDVPSTFYPIHLVAGSLDVIGSSFAGVPSVVAGHNPWISWGVTTHPLDVTDTYLERVVPDPLSPSGLSTIYQERMEPILAIPEMFRANVPGETPDHVVTIPPGDGIPAATLIVPRRNNGPIIELDRAAGMALSIQYTGFSATRELDAFMGFNEARNLNDFRAALGSFDVGSQNFAYADVAGHIAYFTSAEMPLREDLQAGHIQGLPPFFIRNGTGGNEWLPASSRFPGQALPYQILPPEEMPHIIDPPAGWFVNANNDPAGTTLDNDPLNQLRPGGGIYYLNPRYDGFRAGRITQLIRAHLEAGRKFSAADMNAMQADVALLDAQFFTPYPCRALARGQSTTEPALRALASDPVIVEAIGRLSRWDFTTPTGIPEGYDAADADGQRSPPSLEEADASVAATLYAVWRGQLVRSTIDGTLAAHGIDRFPSGGQPLVALRHLLETFEQSGGIGASGLDFFAQPGVADAADRRDIALLSAMASALELLRGPAFEPAFHGSADLATYRWGRLHRIVLDHPLGPPLSIPPAAGAFPPPLEDLPGIPTDGGFGTVDAAAHGLRADSANAFMFGSGPAHRFVADLARGAVRATTSLPGGTSGVPGTPHFVDLLPLWLTNESIPLITRRRGDAPP